MGLLAAAKESLDTLLKDQWREFFYCDSLPDAILMKKGQIRETKKGNNKGTDNIISNGSIIAINEGQCMIIVDQGAVVDLCAVPGEYVYDTSTEPSLFYGNLGENLKKSFETFGKRFSFGGNTGKDQRVYFFNTKVIQKNLFGTPSPIPFRLVDKNVGLDMDTNVKCNGEYSFKLVDPILFYKEFAGNVPSEYKTQELTGSQMRTELLEAMRPAFAQLADEGVRYSALTGSTERLCEILREKLAKKWTEERGIEIVSIGFNTIDIPKEDLESFKELQKKAVLKSADMRAANMNDAMAQAMVGAANNTSTGPMMAFAGVNMAQMAGGAAYQQAEMAAMQQQQMQMQQAAAQPQVQAGAPIPGWKCSCGKEGNTGKFCAECGAPKPSDAGWTCSCGTVNQGKFCQNCGSPRPAGAPIYKCDKCGWEPEDPAHPPKFCQNCGDPFDENDIKR
ncbi:MAG: SPFH domain-containing protein [Lachnospiraceae bacterium]|nr:SPFH domain-containing protein [Lachnospiraceae bacterium]